MTRIIAGSAGGRPLRAPRGRDTRPTTDRVREALFSRIEALMDLDAVHVLDLFAGSGALGLEALSRGGERLLAVERHRPTARLIEDNARALGLGDRVEVRAEDVTVLLERGTDGPPFHLVLADPPYPMTEAQLAPVLAALVDGGWVEEDGLVVLERSARSPEPPWPTGLVALDTRRYGETAVHLAEPGPLR